VHASEPLRKSRGIAVVAPRTGLGAPSYWVPRCVGPFNRAFVRHRFRANQGTDSARDFWKRKALIVGPTARPIRFRTSLRQVERSLRVENSDMANCDRRLSGQFGSWERNLHRTRTRETLCTSAKPRWCRRFLKKCGSLYERPDWLAGAGGFEPPNGGIKIRCLTTWLRPTGPREWPAS
jgi:hypothetical protein